MRDNTGFDADTAAVAGTLIDELHARSASIAFVDKAGRGMYEKRAAAMCLRHVRRSHGMGMGFALVLRSAAAF